MNTANLVEAPSAAAQPPFGIDLPHLLQKQRAAIRRDGIPDYPRRRKALNDLQTILVERQDAIAKAISADFGNRSSFETVLAEIFVLVSELRHMRSHLKSWMRPKRVGADWPFLPATAKIIYQPLGVVGIIAPWNYPVQLTLAPLIGALAAGNHAIIKPSELAPATAELLKNLLAEIYPEEYVAVVTGGVEVAAALSELPLDHLMFTGSTRVGKLVMKAASQNLTPVTLELGGKSPAIISDNYPLRTAAERLVTGKLLNAGQTCIAPDYLLVPEQRRDELVEELKEAVGTLYPSLAHNPDYTWIVNESHYQRLKGYLADARAKGAEIVEINPAGESVESGTRVLPPTLILNVNEDMAIMGEEIFGPLLPVLTYKTLDDAISYVNDRPHPLAMYYFDNDRSRTQRVLAETMAGGVSVNDTLFHFLQGKLPLGGIGPSGMGYYHGHHGFLTFTKQKGVFYQSKWSPVALLRPPYGKLATTMLKFLVGK